jgi:hypothetical protein
MALKAGVITPVFAGHFEPLKYQRHRLVPFLLRLERVINGAARMAIGLKQNYLLINPSTSAQGD